MNEPKEATPIDAFLRGVETGSIAGSSDIFCHDAVIDATVPNWRYSIVGADAIAAELGKWYADPGNMEIIRRTPLPDGELVEFTLDWEENGEPHACHQAHILRVRDGRVAADAVFCGGRWPAPLLAEMQQAAEATSA